MNKKVFQIMYSALVEIASAETFFDGEKRLASIAKQALKQIASAEEEASAPQRPPG